MRLTYLRIALANLRGEIPETYVRAFVPPDQALARLRERTGQDFGMDANKWEAWIRANTKEFETDLE